MLFSDCYIKYHTDLTFLYPNTTKNKHFHTAINNRYLHSIIMIYTTNTFKNVCIIFRERLPSLYSMYFLNISGNWNCPVFNLYPHFIMVSKSIMTGTENLILSLSVTSLYSNLKKDNKPISGYVFHVKVCIILKRLVYLQPIIGSKTLNDESIRKSSASTCSH